MNRLVGLAVLFLIGPLTQAMAYPQTAVLLDQLHRRLAAARLVGERAALHATLSEIHTFHRVCPDSGRWHARAGLALSGGRSRLPQRLDNLLALAHALRQETRYTAALAPAREAVGLARRVGWASREVEALAVLADLQTTRGQLDSARLLLARADSLRPRVHRPSALGLLELAHGNHLLHVGDYPESLEHFQEALFLLDSLRFPRQRAAVFGGIFSVYYRLVERMPAYEFNTRAIDLLQACGCDPVGLNRLYRGRSHIGEYLLWHSLGSMKLPYQKGKLDHPYDTLIAASIARMWEIARAIDHPLTWASTWQRQGSRFGNSQQLDSVMPCFRKALHYADQVPEAYMIRCELTRFMAMSKLKSKEVDSARILLDLAWHYGRRANSESQLELLVHNERQYYEHLNDYRNMNRIYDVYFKTLQERTNEQKRRQVGRLNARLNQRAEELQRAQAARQQYALLVGVMAGLGLLLGIVLLVQCQRQREVRLHHRLRLHQAELLQQTAEIDAQHTEIQAMHAELQATLSVKTSQQQNLQQLLHQQEASVRLAWRMQQALMPRADALAQALPPHFVFFRPRDVVSGDFFWLGGHRERRILAVADCTGHGVPGSFMSALGLTLLEDIDSDLGHAAPGEWLAELDRRIVRALRQYETDALYDGMDVALLALSPIPNGLRLEYAGAGRPLWLLRGGLWEVVAPARYPCGGGQHAEGKQFPTHGIDLEGGDRLYLFSDGITDQFGGPIGRLHPRKLAPSGLQNLLRDLATVPITEQGLAFAARFDTWKAHYPQLDDCLLVGIEVPDGARLTPNSRAGNQPTA